ncbi:hypothetical protein TSMEX_004993 [Taenia solium]|eukprot:TsM_000983400 transcript=TsM_000983400 gene=TsM_000983400
MSASNVCLVILLTKFNQKNPFAVSLFDKISIPGSKYIEAKLNFCPTQCFLYIVRLFFEISSGYILKNNTLRVPMISCHDAFIVPFVTGSLFKFDGEVVYIGFGNSQGEMCNAPSAKWDAGSSAMPRLTLVPNLEESGESAEFEGKDSVSSESAAFRRLGHHAPNSPVSSRRTGNKWKSNGPPSTPLTSSSTHSGNQGMGGTANSQEEAPSSSGSNQSSLDSADGCFMVVISEKHAQVIGFPSRNCYNRVSHSSTKVFEWPMPVPVTRLLFLFFLCVYLLSSVILFVNSDKVGLADKALHSSMTV